MDKTIGSVARYMKQLLPVNIPETYSIDTMFTAVSEEDNIRNGIIKFRDFLHKLFDCMIEDKNLCNIKRKGKEKFSDETTLTVEFPFVNIVRSILINISYHGVLSDQSDSLIVCNWDTLSLKRSLNKNSTTKISVSQMMKSLNFLNDCGICFTGIDLSAKKIDVSKIHEIKITYTDNANILTGWKALGIAQIELATRKNDDILLRCDYRMLKTNSDDNTSILSEFINPLSETLQKHILVLHQHYLDSRMVCEVEFGFLCTHFIYSYKRKAVWRFSASFHNGHRIILKAKNVEKYTAIIETFPNHLQEKILKGYGCDRKSGTGHGNCQKGCEGISFPLDESLLKISKELKIWQDSELTSM